MDVDTFELFFSLLALLALVGAAALVVVRVLSGRGNAGAVALREQLAPVAVPLAFVVALVTSLGSLYFSEVADYRPCTLCWYQRIAMYPLVVVLGIASVSRDFAVRRYVWGLSGVGAAISTYHWLLERFPSLETDVCDMTQPCSVTWFEQFGFVTLAFMAFCGFAAIAALLTLPRVGSTSAAPAAAEHLQEA
jgi:hypothetical protein